MGTFEITRARQQLGFTPSTAVGADIDVRTGEGTVGALIGRGLVQLGSIGIEIHKRRQTMQDGNSAVEADDIRKLASEKFEDYKRKNAQDKWVTEWGRLSAEVGEQVGKLKFSKKALARQQIISQGYSEIGAARAFTDATRQLQAETNVLQPAALVDAFASADPQRKLAQTAIYTTSMKAMGKSDKIIALEIIEAEAKGTVIMKKSAIENIKPLLIAAMGEDINKADGITALNLLTKQLEDSGVLSNTEGAEANKVLGDWVDNYVSGRKKQIGQAKHTKLMNNYKDFSTRLLTEDVSFGDIEIAGFSKDDKERWGPIIKGSTKPDPLATEPNGYSTALDAVMGFASKDISKKQAYEEVMTARFVDGSINNDTYLWALGRLEDPYPRHVSKTIDGIVADSEDFYYHKGVGFFGKDWVTKAERKLLSEKNADFVEWLESENDKNGTFPDGKAMYEKMRELGVAIKTPVNLPQPQLRPIPTVADPLYITDDAKYDKLSSGTEFYDGLRGDWFRKP